VCQRGYEYGVWSHQWILLRLLREYLVLQGFVELEQEREYRLSSASVFGNGGSG
jgi:hypothetical protein